MNGYTVIVGDCIDAMQSMDAGSVDAIVTDPPYGLEFMGKEWDRFRLDDPGTNRNRGERAGAQGEAGDGAGRGGHPARAGVAVSSGGVKRPTTSRCTGCGKRDQYRNDHECDPGAVWRTEVIDPHAAPPTMLAFGEWCRRWAAEAYRALKPGGHMLAFGGSRTYHRMACGVEDAGFEVRDQIMWLYSSGFPKSLNLGGGWGTALKPAHEPLVVARKPLAGTVAGNMSKHGTGALNIGACRLDLDEDLAKRSGVIPATMSRGVGLSGSVDGSLHHERFYDGTQGRWPANVIVDEETGRMIGDVARFYYCAKAGRDEREVGLDGLEPHVINEETPPGTKGARSPRAGAGCTGGAIRNFHPTVKPINLMRWLVRLVTPPGGTVLDPFCGSGSTGIAATMEGFNFIGIEQNAEYAEIARRRIHAAPLALGL